MIIIKTKKKHIKEKINNILKSYKTIIYISFFINIILLIFCYYIISSNKIYSFSGKSEKIKISDGLIILNTDINLINGSSIKYISNEDYEIKEYKVGYYSMDENKLVEIVSTSESLETPIKLSEIINNFISLNVTEKNSSDIYFTNYKKRLIDKDLYFVIEAKTANNDTIFDKVKLNMTKISKY